MLNRILGHAAPAPEPARAVTPGDPPTGPAGASSAREASPLAGCPGGLQPGAPDLPAGPRTNPLPPDPGPAAAGRQGVQSTGTPDVVRLRAELRQAHDLNRRLSERLSDLQAANEAAYAAAYDHTGGPALDPRQPFGTGQPRPAGRHTTEQMS